MANRVVIGMTGATGQVFGVKALQILQNEPIKTHLIVSDAAKINLKQEGDLSPSEVLNLADVSYENRDIAASLASGSYQTMGMLVVPCSMKTLSNIAHGNSGNLITRAADVTLKEQRNLILMPREKPLNKIHLKNMMEATDAGAVIMPPLLSFYHDNKDLEAMVARTVARALDLVGVEIQYEEWTGIKDG